MTPGHRQALRELQRVAAVPESPVRIAEVSDQPDRHDRLLIKLTINCSGTRALPPLGIKLEPSEAFSLFIPSDFPLRRPSVGTENATFAGRPHVLWGYWICLYTSSNEWDPSAGMWGFIDRLLTWLARAAEGTLSVAVLPWHPPVARASVNSGPLIVQAEVPDWARKKDLWHAWLAVGRVGNRILEAGDWMTDPREIREHPGCFAVPVVALAKPADFTYPDDAASLWRALASHGFDEARLNETLDQTLHANRAASGAPFILAIGSPAPVGADAPGRIAHFVAWQFANRSLGADPGWIKVYDERPSTTVRRDRSRPAGWITGKAVMVLGCGALGAPIAEHCARAGAAVLTLVDDGHISPGILVRQPYEYLDVGRAKVHALADRLQRVVPTSSVTPVYGDALEYIKDETVDLIVDATANWSVAARLERGWRHRPRRPPVLSVMVGHMSDLGVATLALPAASGAGVDILRRLTVAASADESLTGLLDDLYPDPPRTRVFQPEPGCSDPTYVGSAADLAAIAATLLNGALTVLAAAPTDGLGADQASPTRFGIVTSLPTGLRPAGLNRRVAWTNDVICRDRRSGFEIRMDPAVFARAREAAIAAAAADSAGGIETGGVLLGQVDMASRVVWVTRAEGLPPDSAASAHRLVFDVTKLHRRYAQLRRRTRGSVSLVGMWHTHPNGRPDASDQDKETMRKIVGGAPALAQALLLILGGGPDVWRAWLDRSKFPDLYARMYFAGEPEQGGRHADLP